MNDRMHVGDGRVTLWKRSEAGEELCGKGPIRNFPSPWPALYQEYGIYMNFWRDGVIYWFAP